MPNMTESEFKKHMASKEFTRLYVLWGTEKKYVKTYTDKLVTKVMGKNISDFNYHEFKDNYDIQEICLSMLSVPFMSEYNFVKISDINLNELLKNEKEQLFNAIKDIPDTTVVVFSMPTLEIDAKKPGDFKTILKEAEKNGVVVEFKKMGDMALEKHLSTLATRNNVSLSRINADKIINMCGNDLTTLINELDKLCAYVGEGNEITDKDIDLLVTKNLEAKVFSLADAVTRGKSTEAMTILDTLFYQREEPIAILTVLSNAYIDYYRGRVADECGVQTSVIAQEFNYKNRAFALNKKTMISTQGLRDSIDLLIEVETKMKSVSVNQKITLEKLISKLLLIAQKGRAYA
ncbi:MAG: DNA polymerase III subunit delta [Ruminococcus sp.]|nr:DNA polymerase III subunit delta [Ruminococcus sp.]